MTEIELKMIDGLYAILINQSTVLESETLEQANLRLDRLIDTIAKSGSKHEIIGSWRDK